MFSTPFGIIGIHTRSKLKRPCRRLRVLNAFRHHRNSHSRLHRASAPTPHVLNAFRHHRNSHSVETEKTVSPIKSAQRLSASSEFTQSSSQSICADSTCSQRLSASSEFTLGRN